MRFFFNDTAATEIYTLSLHDALPIFVLVDLPVQDSLAIAVIAGLAAAMAGLAGGGVLHLLRERSDRKSTRLNSSHANISYAVFCLKKNNNSNHPETQYTICWLKKKTT